LATYNGERFLEKQLESISDQSRPPDELIVGDDGSVDATPQIITKFKAAASFPVTFIRRERTGVAANFLLSTEVAQGDLVAFADQDDVWLPNKLERSVEVLEHNAADLVVHGAVTVDEELRPKRTGYRNVRRSRVEERFHGNVWVGLAGNAMLFRKSLLDECDWTMRPTDLLCDRQINHDDLVRFLASVRGRTVRIPDRLVLYRQHDTNTAGARLTSLQRAYRYATDKDSGYALIEISVKTLRAYAVYFSSLSAPEHRRQATDYFIQASDLQVHRMHRLRTPGGRALPLIAAAALRGEYSVRTPGGLSWGSLLRDGYIVATRSARHTTEPWPL
jgi:glycosyltransferase involved in cell wall biosynthesis